MKNLFTIILFLFVGLVAANAQCSIDYTFYPTETNYGLHPEVLPDGVVGQFYEQDLTFYLPQDTTQDGFYVVFEDFHITSISLPLGLTWQCNNYTNGCHYNPADDQYGCVNISGIPLQAGEYSIAVELVATHDLSYLVGTENVSFSLPMTVLPDTSTSSNEGFAMTNPSGCAPITVSFTNNNTDMLSYNWDFGNGNISTAENPVDQVFNEPGEYVINYSAAVTEASFFLESISVNSAACSDNVAGDPDYFYTVSGPSGTIVSVSQGNYITTSLPLNITLPSPVLLSGQSIVLDLYDDDSWFLDPSAYEDCGSISFSPIQEAGSWSASGGSLSINYSVMEIPANEIISSDTVFVYDYPEQAILEYDTLSNSLSTSTSSFAMQWYYQGSPIPNAITDTINPMYSGLYWLVTINENGCVSVSDEFLVVICNPTYQPTTQSSGMSAWMVDSALYDDVQWYYEGELMVDETEPFIEVSTSGYYYINAVDTFGCSYYSDSLLICDESLQVAVGVTGETIWVADSVDYASFVWSQNSNVINGVNGASYTASVSGYYSVAVTDGYGCSYTSGQTLVCVEDFKPSIFSYENIFWTSDSVDVTIQWYLNGSAISGATNAVHQGSDLGYYTVQVTDEFGCSYMSDVLTYTSVEEQLFAQKINLFPNPTKDYVTVEIGIPSVSTLKVEVSDLLGRQVKSVRYKSAPYQLDLSDLENGIYLLNLSFDGNKISRKVVKH
ncbi:MAG: T9SS type A sorting domain-containing protein [Bacteroidetes bacterium]|nr:T9SS type A sorting domain-containing protein [Bacteroidota bacterium]